MTEAKSAQPQLPPLDQDCSMEIARWQNAICNDWSCCPKYAEVDCRERQLLSALAENESLKADRDEAQSAAVNYEHRARDTDALENWRDKALELIREYRRLHLLHCVCPTCIKADALLKEKRRD